MCADIKKLLPAAGGELGAVEARAAAAAALRAAREARRRELAACTLALEAAACLLWRHLRTLLACSVDVDQDDDDDRQGTRISLPFI